MSLTKYNIFFLCLGTILTLLGLLSISLFPCIYNKIITAILTFGPNTEMFKAWQKQDSGTLDVYFFNWTNPEDIYDLNIKPKFVELGPYRYKAFKEKTNITWNKENQTISYQYYEKFYFDEENSPANHSDVITSINMVALTAAHWASDWNVVLKQSVKLALISSKIYVQKPMRELIFEGYRDSILEVGKIVALFSEDDNDMDRFSWLGKHNGTIGFEGAFNMKTSPDASFGTVQKWEYENNTNFYEGHCGDVQGSAGEFYPKNLRQDRIKFFFPKMCRTLQFNFEAITDVKEITGYKYSADGETLDNGTINKENACYCNGKCMPSGLLNVSSCRKNAPIFLSLPHFYHADPIYVNSIEGVKPIKEKHQFYFTLQPETGMIIDGAGRLQLNVLLKPYSDYLLYKNVPEIVIPVFWSEQKGVIPDDIASNFSFLLNLPLINQFVSIIMMMIGMLIILSVFVNVSCCKQKKITKYHAAAEPMLLKRN